MRLLVLLPMLAALSGVSYWLMERAHDPVPETAAAAPDAEGSAGGEPAPEALPVGLEVAYAERPYPVSGSTPDEVLASLRERGPRTDGEVFFGLTKTEMDLTYRVTDLDAGCAVTDVRLGLEVAVTLPEWTPRVDTDRALVRDWGRFFRALSRHEATHREIAEDGAEGLFRHLDGLRRAGCPALEAELRHRLRAAQRDLEAAHRDYDARTQHGRTEGATWPVRPRALAPR